MQGTRFRLILKTLSASCVSAHFDQFKNQSHGTDEINNACKCEIKKYDLVKRMVDKLEDLALYTVHQRCSVLVNRRTRLCDTDTLNVEKIEIAQDKEFVEDILKKFHEASNEYRNLEKNSCCSERQSVGISSTAQQSPAKEINGSDKNDGYSGKTCGNANNQNDYVRGLVDGKRLERAVDMVYWIGFIVGSACGLGASAAFIILFRK